MSATPFALSDAPLTEEQRSILPRLQKLMTLAKGKASVEESASAMAKLQDLLLTHNLEASILEQDVEGGAHAKELLKGGSHEYQRNLWYWVAELNFCMYWVQQVYVDKVRYNVDRYTGEKYIRDEGHYEWHHCFVGRQRNVAATKAMGIYLQQAIDRHAMEFVHNEPKMRYSKRANSFRVGASETITQALYKRRQALLAEEQKRELDARERAAEAASKGLSSETAVTIASVVQSERDANEDFRRGKPSGTTAAERAARAAARARAEAEYTQWAAAHPEEAAERERDRQKEAEKAARRRERVRTSTSDWAKYDGQAFMAGRDKGKAIGIDPQAEGFKSKGALS
jgi:hypothetical protein